MTTKRIALAVGAAALCLAAASAAVASGAGQPRVVSTTVSDYDLSGLGLDLAPLDSTTAARVASGQSMSASAAAARASTVLRGTGAPEALHVMARREVGSALRPVWLVLYKGGDAAMFPAGPVGTDLSAPSRKAPAYTGVMLDDVTGDVLLVFGGGTQ